uniref:Uncharacterized protein n=1 Tax=Arundo donax TaxID=35708 RepID=A0A0A9BKE7_ARUDO
MTCSFAPIWRNKTPKAAPPLIGKDKIPNFQTNKTSFLRVMISALG